MNRSFLHCAFILIFLCFSTQHILGQKLMPEPKKLHYGNGRFALAHAGVLLSDSASTGQQRTVKGFTDYVKEHSGMLLPVVIKEQPGISLLDIVSEHSGEAFRVPDEKTGEQSLEWYQIKITTSRVTVRAKTDAGVFYALQTLKQLMSHEGTETYLPELELEDYPSFVYRGIMMDFAHGGLLTEEEIKRQIDFLAGWKINQYYFYNEVSIEMKGYSLINYNAKYSQEQIKRIVAYGRERYVDVIPFVNFYGHLHELLRIQKYSGLGIGKYGHDLDPRKPEVKALLKDWISQYAAMFPSAFIHVGFDETWETERLSKTNKTISQEKLYIDHLGFVSGLLQQGGKTVMVWTDISKYYPGIIAKFPKQVIPVVWDYGSDSTSVNNWIKPIVKEKMPFFVQSGVDGWAHLYPTETTWTNIDICLKAANRFNGMGYITSVWTDPVQPLLRSSWMFMAYGAVACWQNAPVERNDFIAAYSKIVYPEIAGQMERAFKKMSESQVYLRKCLGQTQTHMWINPFLSYNLKHTNEHLQDYEQSRLAAELAQESLSEALSYNTADSAFIKTLLVNCRQLSYTCMRFLWAKKMVDRWDESIRQKDGSWYSDITETPHGLIMDMLDYTMDIKEEYRQSWLSENMPYRLGTITARFDTEYQFWRRLSMSVLDYRYNGKERAGPLTFQQVFKVE